MSSAVGSGHGVAPAVIVSHAVDSYNRFPGEVVTFFTRLEIQTTIASLQLRLSLPEGLILGDLAAPTEQADMAPVIETGDGFNDLVWSITGDHAAGTAHEFQVEALIAPTEWDLELESWAIVTAPDDKILARETVRLAVRAKSSYLQYLPSLFERDELMGRFLMLFESFWRPIDRQIDSIDTYFDPRMAPSELLPWLASWLDLELDERWPEAQQRQLLRWAIALHRSRGTKWGLLKYLELYTGHKADIIERISNNFIIGAEARLGPNIAFGRGNVPHTFGVSLRLPELDIEDDEERTREEKLRRRTIESIIEMQKPAHTVYTLDLQIVSAETLKRASPSSTDQAGEDALDEMTAWAADWFS